MKYKYTCRIDIDTLEIITEHHFPRHSLSFDALREEYDGKIVPIGSAYRNARVIYVEVDDEEL